MNEMISYRIIENRRVTLNFVFIVLNNLSWSTSNPSVRINCTICPRSSDPATMMGWGVKAGPLRNFLKLEKKIRKKMWILSTKGLVARPLKKDLFPYPFYILSYYLKWVTTSWTHTVCRGSSDPFYIVTYYIK